MLSQKPCNICSASITPFMSFGKMPLANGFLTAEQVKGEYFFELAPAFCAQCKTFQLMQQPDPQQMFHENYAFFSGTSRHMAAHFKDMASHLKTEFLHDKDDPFVVELGSNDGVMLKHFAKQNIRHLGVEPSENVARVARENGIETLCTFFNENTAKKIVSEHGQADIISAANVMCHIPDLGSVARGVQALLKPDGVFVFEDPYLGEMLARTSYDQIYDEHVYIFSVQAVQNIFAPFGLTVFHAAAQKTHGGSMRYYLCREGAHDIRPSVVRQLSWECEEGLDQVSIYQRFKQSCEKNKHDLCALLSKLKAENKTVMGYAATSKSTTILNYCDIGPDLIACISDTTPLKQGRLSPGQHIPVVTYEAFQKNPPDYAVLFAWNHAEEVFAKEKAFLEKGGKWILFTPNVRVLDAASEISSSIAS